MLFLDSVVPNRNMTAASIFRKFPGGGDFQFPGGKFPHPGNMPRINTALILYEGSPEGIRVTMEERICERDEF